MTCIIHRKVKDTTYVIESTSYRDKQGRPRTKQRCLGKLDKDGVLISNKTKLPSEIHEVKIVKKKYIVVPKDSKKKSKLSGEPEKISCYDEYITETSPE